MISLAMQTILYGTAISYLIILVVMLQTWYQNRKRYAGISLWVLAWAFLFLGFSLLCLRDSIPDWISIVVANSLVVGGTLLIYFGLRLFESKKVSSLSIGLAIAFFIIFICIHTYFTSVHDFLLARSYNTNIALTIIYLASAYLLYFRIDPQKRRYSWLTGVTFLLLTAAELARIIGFGLVPNTTNEFISFLSYIM